MTLAQLLRLAAKLIAFLRTERMTAHPPEPKSLPDPKTPATANAGIPHSWIGVSLDQDMHEALQALARDKNLTMEETVRRTLSEFLKSRPRG